MPRTEAEAGVLRCGAGQDPVTCDRPGSQLTPTPAPDRLGSWGGTCWPRRPPGRSGHRAALTASPLWSPDDPRLWLSVPVPPGLLSDIGCSLHPAGQPRFSHPCCDVVGLSEALGAPNARDSHFFPPGGAAGSPRRALTPRGVLGTAASAVCALACVICWPLGLCPVRTEAWFLVCSQTTAGGRPRPRPASGTPPRLRGCRCARGSWLVARGVSSAPPACSLSALFPPAQYQVPTSFPEGPGHPGPESLPGLRILIDPPPCRLLASFGAFWGSA